MSVSAQALYLVNAASDPVAVRIQGRANFQNSHCLDEFVQEMIRQGKTRFVIDFQDCASMDSTFLGVLAGLALKLRKNQPPGSLVLARPTERNLALIRSLGLHRLATIDAAAEVNATSGTALNNCGQLDEVTSARHVLAAHENLVAADSDNQTKFQDVLTFLKQRVEQK